MALSQDDVLLLLADGAEGPYDMDRIRLMKGAFLAVRRLDLGGDLFQFRPYDYGPMDPGVYRARDWLLADGLLESDADSRYGTYRPTEAGQERVQALAKDHPDLAGAIRRIGAEVTAQSFSELTQSIYNEYPEYRERSVLI